MSGFLDTYGAGDERRARNIKLIAVSVVVLAILSGIGYFLFHNYPEEQQAKRFFRLLAGKDYQAAYNMWATTDTDRRDYPMDAFLRDWGPPALTVRDFDILDAESCGNVVIVDADLGVAGDRKLWVSRKNLTLSFPPYEQGCLRQNRIYNLYRNVKYKLHGRIYK